MNKRRSGRAVPVAAALGLIAGLACDLATQAPGSPAPTVIQMKRLVEAADGSRTGAAVWVVLGGDPQAEPLGTFPDLKAATEFAQKTGNGARAFGPVQTDLEPPSGIAACVHGGATRWYTARCVPPARFTPRSDVATLSLMITRKDGSRDSIPIANDADAVFMSPAAIDKFAVPYYVRVIGLDAVQRLRTEAARSFANPSR
ncbi:MAG: hypothetical protein U0163_16640 [Gemmatimonadaceae bacterium]